MDCIIGANLSQAALRPSTTRPDTSTNSEARSELVSLASRSDAELERCGWVPYTMGEAPEAGGMTPSETSKVQGARCTTWCFDIGDHILNSVTASRRSMMLASAIRLGLGVFATLLVWLSIGLQAVFLQPLKVTVTEPVCGTGLLVFLLAVALCWGVTLLALLFDCVQMHRGKLSRSLGWLRTLPAAVAVLLTPAVLFLS